jgi:hypothetical protein
LLVVTAMFAIHFALRAATIKMHNEGFIMSAPLVLAVVAGCTSGLLRKPYTLIFSVALVTSFLSSSAWAYERVNETSAIDFLRDDRGFLRYVNDLDINLIIVAFQTVFSSAVGWLLGASLRYTRRDPIRRGQRGKARRTKR